jgi:TRAP-type C4-dicarboxylate transport system substrate-binding protein
LSRETVFADKPLASGPNRTLRAGAGAGASIASMASSEIYNAMQTGVLNAANTSSSSFMSYRIYEQVNATHQRAMLPCGLCISHY